MKRRTDAREIYIERERDRYIHTYIEREVPLMIPRTEGRFLKNHSTAIQDNVLIAVETCSKVS